MTASLGDARVGDIARLMSMGTSGRNEVALYVRSHSDNDMRKDELVDATFALLTCGRNLFDAAWTLDDVIVHARLVEPLHERLASLRRAGRESDAFCLLTALRGWPDDECVGGRPVHHRGHLVDPPFVFIVGREECACGRTSDSTLVLSLDQE